MDKIYTVSSLNDRPFIRLTGKWLENNGFNKGDKIRLFYDKEILIFRNKKVQRGCGCSCPFFRKNCRNVLQDLI